MKAHTVTVDFNQSGKLLLEHAGEQYGIQCLLDSFALRWGVSPTTRERDLFHIAVSIYAADRIVKRPDRFIKLRIGVVGRDLIDPKFTNRLNELLGFLSGDEWDIQLYPTRTAPEIPTQCQLALDYKTRPNVCLYSGGLDSAAGLAIRRNEPDQPWLAVVVGHQSGIRHRAIKQIESHLHFRPQPLQTAELVAGLRGAPPIKNQEKTQRTRGILFCVTAGLAAKWSGASQVEVFENGVGAFNLPLMTGMLYGGRTTRGAHPCFLSEIGDLISAALHHPLRFTLPFCWDTKAEMLRRLPTEQALELVELSHSCIHTSIREPGKDHCGTCPACIERQITLNAAGLADRWNRYQNIIREPNKHVPHKAEQYIGFRRRRAQSAINRAEDYRILQSDYLRLCGLKLPNGQRREFDRLMRRDGHECLAWANGMPAMT